MRCPLELHCNNLPLIDRQAHVTAWNKPLKRALGNLGISHLERRDGAKQSDYSGKHELGEGDQ